jgi:hypothetical protein
METLEIVAEEEVTAAMGGTPGGRYTTISFSRWLNL